MAKSQPTRSKSLDELLFCQVCFEDYQEIGEHVPRILPCHHTLCGSCTGKLIHRNRIQCPECRAEHEVKKDERNFPQNKYILILLKKQSSELKEDTSSIKKCTKHNKDEMFFCKQKGCQKAICPSCLSAMHLGHKVIEIQTAKQEVLEITLKKAEHVSHILGQKIKIVQNAQRDTIKKAQTNIYKLKKKKQEVLEKFDQMVKAAEDQMDEMNAATNGEINAMTEDLDILNNVKQDIATENESSYEDILEQLDTVSELDGKVRKIFSGKKTFSYPEYTEAENLYLGEIIKKEITVDLSTHFQGELDINTGFKIIHHMSVLNDNAIVICGERRDGDGPKLKHYNPQTGRKLTSVKLQASVEGMSEVKLRDDSSLALTYRGRDDFNKVLYTHSVTSHKPGRLCKLSPSVLLYENTSAEPHEFHSLDCSGNEPTPMGDVINTNIMSDIEDICCTEHDAEKLLVVADKDEMIHVHNTVTGELKWTIKERQLHPQKRFKPLGVAADWRGHLFVSDQLNMCVQMFSVSDGQHLGHFRLDGKQSIGPIKWRDGTSSLIVACERNNEYRIRCFSVNL